MQEQLILNRYRPITEVGSGGFSTVQLAWDMRIQRRVAIKCIQLREEDLSLGVSPGLDEARTAALLSDNTIVGVYDFEIQGTTAYLIMEYIDGLTLTQLLSKYGTELSLDAVAAIFSSVVRALEIAHENQVLHLDIKPDNVLINRQGHVKVSDFGLATLSDRTGFGAASGGTIGYMPPEQMRRESLDARSDEWALASMTYEMLTGENPFLANDLGQAEVVIREAELVLPSLCRDGLASGIDDVIFYALDPDREERYENVSDFAEEAESFLGNPAKGRRELAMLVGQAAEAYENEDEVEERGSFFDHFGEDSRAALMRLWALLNVCALSFVALKNIPAIEGWTNPLFWGIFVLLAVAAVLKAHLGAILALLALCAALFANDALMAGALLLFVTGLWWFFIGRISDRHANTALASVLFASLGINQITPLVAGFTLNVRDAIINTLVAFFLSVLLASFGTQDFFAWNVFSYSSFENLSSTIVLIIQQPMVWCTLVAWVLAAVLMRLTRLWQARFFVVLGTVVASLVLLSALCLATWFSSGQTSWFPELLPILSTAASGFVMLLICGLSALANTSDPLKTSD